MTDTRDHAAQEIRQWLNTPARGPIRHNVRTGVPRWKQAEELRERGLKYAEISRIMGCSLASVGNHLRRAREEQGRQERKAQQQPEGVS